MSVRRLILLVAFFAVLAVALTAAYLQRGVPATEATWPGLPFQSEDQWIVSQTAAAVVDLAEYAKTSTAESVRRLSISRLRQDLTQPRFMFRVGSRDVTISLTTNVWDPDAYVQLARSVGAEGSATTTVENNDVLTALLGLSVETFRLQNDAISIALQRDYRNPANHEAAALLLAVFALRESAGYFYDPRLAISRASAHLAVARAMRNGSSAPSDAGELAHIVIEIEAGRTASAVDKLDAFERVHQSSAAQAWARTLRRRATLDWRVPVDSGAPLIERLEYMRSLALMMGASQSFEYLRTRPGREPVPDWGWRTFDLGMTVESGNEFVDETIDQTLREAAQVLSLSPSPTRADVTAILSREPAVSSIARIAGRQIDVLDQGLWSAFYQREVAHVAMTASDFYRTSLGIPLRAQGFEHSIDALMGGTPLWPIVLRLRVESECRCGLADESKRAEILDTYRRTMTRVAGMIHDKPQLVPYMAWGWVLHVPPGATPVDTPHRSRWFRTIYPTGTAYESRRLQNQPVVPDDFVAHADAIHALSPWDPMITVDWSSSVCYKRHGCSPAEESAHFSRIAEYSLIAMRKAAAADPNPVAGLRRLCDASVSDCSTLADWMVRHDRFPEAAETYQRLFDHELDRVRASNEIEWLVRYYQKAGRIREARSVAENAAGVGSEAGMEAFAGFLDRQGDHDQAEALYREILRRYDDGTPLLAFLLRRADATGGAPSTPEYQALLDRYFDGRLGRIEDSPLSGKPSQGLFVESTSEWNTQYFRRGDIIVAVDGIRVRNNAQSAVLYDRSFDAPLRYTVWRGDAYVHVEGPFRQHYYGVNTVAYPLPSRPAATSH
jgi:tetratricopeptide (TPR) repeat protein